ncbi:extensin family protein [Rhizobiales bacterium]|uniref:extensin family protein n=1 Tax=Hongsoonwoonella zoysiae TaxID=2821844 RepID=UPI0015607A20|nr:extensin family protein [Hongsoonwoonella zoysiae]NRG17806.1 extensin family protein [Hongsoonwoonella zoysiae]
MGARSALFRGAARHGKGNSARDRSTAYRRPIAAVMMLAAVLAPDTAVIAEQENAAPSQTSVLLAPSQDAVKPKHSLRSAPVQAAVPRPKAGSKERIGVAFGLVDFERKHDGPVCPLNSGERRVLPEALVAGECEMAAPVDVDSFGPGGVVRLRESVTLDCDFAIAVENFVANEMSDMTLIQFGQRLVGLDAAASSGCPKGDAAAKAGDDATGGRTIEFIGFKLANDSEVVVSDSWGKETPEGNFLMVLQRKGCARFEKVHAPGEQRIGGEGLRFAEPCDGNKCKNRPCP